jgi:hypothetical protein
MGKRMRCTGGLCAAVVAGVGGVARAAEVSETFDTAASASAHGWVAAGGTGSVIGFSNTSEAGGVPGEARALVSGFSSNGTYFDRTLGGTLTASQPFSFQGKLDVLQNMPGLQSVLLGYHSANRSDALGLFFTNLAGGPQIKWGILGQAPRTPGGSVATFVSGGGDATREVASTVDRTFSFTYDPQGGDGNGRLLASVTGAGEPIALDLSPNNRAMFDNAQLDAFGIHYALFSPGNALSADYRFDDVTYTVVPEPAVPLLGLASLLGLRRRR